MEIEKLMASAVVAAVVSAIVCPLIFLFLKRWDDKNRRKFDIRFAEYKHYLRALEQISAADLWNFEQFLSETYAKCFEGILLTEGKSKDPLLDLNKKVNELKANVHKTFTQATQALNGLKLVCSSALLEMINEFIDIQKKLVDELVMIKLQHIDLKNTDAMVTGDMKIKGERVSELFENIVTQMRKELKIE